MSTNQNLPAIRIDAKTCTGFHSTLGHLKAQASPQIQAQAATGVIKRLIPDKAELFQVTVDPRLGPVGKDTFKVA